MELHQKQSTEEENIDESLELLSEFLDRFIATGTDTDTEEIDIQINADLKIVEEMFDKLTNGEIDLESACSNSVFERVKDTLDRTKKDLIARSRTAELWFMYLDMITIRKQFIKAERVGNWNLHLYSMSRMLPFFVASGHNLYAKSANIYLQNLEKVSSTHSSVYKLFQEEYHVIRSDRHWAGLSTDLVIEQMIMRSLKTSGGLTWGRVWERHKEQSGCYQCQLALT